MVTFFNSFQVPAGREEEFLHRWQEVNAYMVQKPGYVRHQLHRSLAPDAQFRFVNHSIWQSAELWQAAHDDGFKALLSDPVWQMFPATGALYEVVHEGATN